MQVEDSKKYAKLDNFLMIKTLGSGFNSKYVSKLISESSSV